MAKITRDFLEQRFAHGTGMVPSDWLETWKDFFDTHPELADRGAVEFLDEELYWRAAQREAERWKDLPWPLEDGTLVRVRRWYYTYNERYGTTDDASWNLCVLLPAGLPESEERYLAAKAGIDWYDYYTHPGGPYHHRPFRESTNTRVLYRQHGGLDI